MFGIISTANAQLEQYHLDRPHTQILFSVSHLGLSRSHGKFLDYSASIVFNHDHIEKSSVNATIQTNSLTLNDPAWDAHVKGKDMLDTQTYPTMTFKSLTIKPLTDKTADITGELTLHGVTKPVTLHVTYNGANHDPFGNDFRAGFLATTNIKRTDFGITSGIPFVGDDIEIKIEVEAIREDNEKRER